MDARDLEGIWEAHARHDPLWAILSDPTKKDRGWEIDRFFESGEREIRFLLRDLEGVSFARRDALDFGCGVGRLSHALAHHFESVTGIDVSPTMIDLASALNPDPERVAFVHNASDDLASLESESFDFVYTNIVLQHIPPELAKGYIVELVRVLRPGGALVFQLPSHPRPEEELTVRAMADNAYRAEIRVDEWPRVTAPDARVGLRVHVTNRSPQLWHPSALGQVNVGNHWIASDGSMERQDDARAGLPAVVRPGDEVEVLIAVTTPSAEGEFQCELDLVHETISWFKDRGSTSCALPFRVVHPEGAETFEATPRPPAPESSKADVWTRVEARLPDDTREPEPFPMFGIPRDEVVALLEANRTSVLAVDEDGHAGWEWISHRYTAKKLG